MRQHSAAQREHLHSYLHTEIRSHDYFFFINKIGHGIFKYLNASPPTSPMWCYSLNFDHFKAVSRPMDWPLSRNGRDGVSINEGCQLCHWKECSSQLDGDGASPDSNRRLHVKNVLNIVRNVFRPENGPMLGRSSRISREEIHLESSGSSSPDSS
jgi:hypothetical protein